MTYSEFKRQYFNGKGADKLSCITVLTYTILHTIQKIEIEMQKNLTIHTTENEQFMLEKKFRALCEAWKLARSHIFCEGQYIQRQLLLHLIMYNCSGLEENLVQSDLNEDTKMSFLVPTMHGKGFLTCALVDHLVSLHNDVIKKSQEFVEITLKRYGFSSPSNISYSS